VITEAENSADEETILHDSKEEDDLLASLYKEPSNQVNEVERALDQSVLVEEYIESKDN